MTIWPRSLAVQLIVTLLLAQGLGILLALIAFPLLGPFTTYRSIANHSARQMVTESLRREGTGRWRIDPTPRLQAYARSRPHLRWAARSGAGDTVEGSAPELVQVLRQIGDLRTVDEDNLRIAQPGGNGVVYVAANRSHVPGIMIAIAGDEFHSDDVSAFFRFFLPAVLPVYGPVLLGMMLVLPFALRRVLSKVRRAAAAAALIDVDSLDTRLPGAKLPSEFEPLVVSINAALERLRQGWERQRAFTANAAHEIRTPITVLLGRIDLLPADAPLRDALMRDVRRLALLSDQLLANARLESSDAAVKSLDLIGLVRGVVADWAPIAIAAGCGVVFETEVERLDIRGSARAIEGAAGALLDNALKVEPRDREVEVSVTADARVMVRDHGPGIDLAHRACIFEPFWRAKETTKGFGLGLASVKRTAQLHGGHVTVETASGGGAVFVLAFPAPGRTPSIAAPTPDQAPRSNLG